MSRYVKKKHGIIIGSGNVFFYRDENGEFHDFPCIMSFSTLIFDEINSWNVWVRSPAEQLVWDRKQREVEVTFGTTTYTELKTYYDLTWTARCWLDLNAEGWGFQLEEDRKASAPPIFFKKRKHALAFYDFIDQNLKGMRYDR